MRKDRLSQRDMEILFRDLLEMEDVEAVMLFTFDGKLIFKNFRSSSTPTPTENDWWPPFLKGLKNVREAEMVFEKRRIYVRKTAIGFLLVVLGSFAPMALVRLNCDLLLPSLRPKGVHKGFKRFFKSKR